MVDLYDIQNIVFSRIAYYGKQKYPKALFTTSNTNQTKPTFPTVYVHYLGGLERGADLTGESLNAITAPFQIEVYTNKSDAEADKVMQEIMKIMKNMKFQISQLSFSDNQDGVYRKIARFSRIIGAGDTL